MSRSAQATEIRQNVFADRDMSPTLKLFTLAAIHLWETAPARRELKTFGKEHWSYKALRLCGYEGTVGELTPILRGIIREDVPKFRVDFHAHIPCEGKMLRPAGAPCTRKVSMRGSLPNPLTGERTLTGVCRDPRHVAEYEAKHKAAWAAYRANGEPSPKPNSGGLLLRYFTSGIENLYSWADRDYQRGDKVPESPTQPLAAVISLADRRPNT